MDNVIIPKPGTLYSEYLCQGSDGNYYVRNNGQWVKVEGGSENITLINCMMNPLCPVAKKGDKFVVSWDGKFGGSRGPDVEVGDLILCYNDNAQEREWEERGRMLDSSFIIVEKNLGNISQLIENTPISRLTPAVSTIETVANISTYGSIGAYERVTGRIGRFDFNFVKVDKNVHATAAGIQIEGYPEYIRITSSEDNGQITLFSLQSVDQDRAVKTIISNKTDKTVRIRGYWHLNDTIDGNLFVDLSAGETIKLFGVSNGIYDPGEWFSY